MLKKILVILVVSLLVTSVVYAQTGIPGSGWWTGEQIQNVGSSTATIVITAYDKNSTSSYSYSTTAAAGSSINVGPATIPNLPTGFIGSAVVSSDQPIKAIVNVTNQQSGSSGVAGGKAAAQYQGTEAAAGILYFPLAKNNRFGKTTAFYIQNTGSSAATATATFKMDDGNSYNYTTPSIGSNQMVVVLPSNAGVPTSGTNRNNIGSMSITSAQPLAGTVLEFTEGQAIATALKGTRGFTSADFGTKAYAPVVKNARFGRTTGIQVLNVSSSPVNVTISYVGTSSTCKGAATQDVRANVLAGRSTTVVQGPGSSNFTPNCTGSATIEATGNIVAIVNEDNDAGNPEAGTTYSALSAAAATTKVSAPLFKNNRFGFDTGLQIQNVGSATANIVATFACKGNNSTNTPFTAVSLPQPVLAGGAVLFFKPYDAQQSMFTGANPFSLTGANCGVTVTSDQPIVAIANETPRTAGALDDNNYEGFNLAP